VNDPLHDRQVRRKLAVLRHVQEVTGNVALTCRYFGITRQAYYTSGTAATRPRDPKACAIDGPSGCILSLHWLRPEARVGFCCVMKLLSQSLQPPWLPFPGPSAERGHRLSAAVR